MANNSHVDRQLWLKFSKFLTEQTGLHFPPSRLPDLQKGTDAAAGELGFSDPTAFINHMLDGGMTGDQLQVLVQFLTVGETYFFRDRRVFEVFEKEVLAPLVASRRRGQQRLRLWSAACCTGEEAYSLSICVRKVLPDLANWNATILATDINTLFLKKAARAVYSRWSFRDELPGLREQYFTPAGEGRWELISAVREMVTFGYMNLAEGSFPSVLNNTNAMDVIFCRNVLIYFSSEQSMRVLSKLAQCLVPGGWLVVAPAETAGVSVPGLSPVNFGGATLYRKQAKADTLHHVVEKSPVPSEISDSWQTLLDEKLPLLVKEEKLASREPLPQNSESDQISEIPKAAAPGPVANVSELMTSAKRLANEGRLQEALTLCDELVVLAKMDPAAHYLRAMVMHELGVVDEAVSALKRSIYLEPTFILAHFGLGNLYRVRGRTGEADKHFENALVLAESLNYEDLLPEGDGLTAGRLAEIINAVRASA